ncbi:MAG: glycosyltransferase family A protein, partial [Proteobacteria bacterium]|nr:glycosyltransferase family A protein [Pseudomonadota bacterium]
MPLISVIITTKNESKNIENCLKSIQQQTFKDFEIIVIDNNSTDDTKEISKRYTDKVFNLGPERSAQRNYGVSVSSGRYVLYLDADMILENNILEDCKNIVANDPHITGVYIPEKIIGQGWWIKVRDFERSFYDGTVIDAVRFIPKQIFEKVKGFDASLCGPEDWDFDKKIRNLGKVVVANSSLNHNEGLFDLKFYLKKKSYYAGSFDKYTARWGKDDMDVKKQLGF